jgi:hypothetical protein
VKIISMISRRKLHPPGRRVLITQLAAVHKQKKSAFFAFAQSELEDVDKISIRLNLMIRLRWMGLV